MKTMTCKQLGGPCKKEFNADTFEEMVEMSKNHGMEMYKLGDEAHIKVMNEMKEHMDDSDAMKDYMETKKKLFDLISDE